MMTIGRRRMLLNGGALVGAALAGPSLAGWARAWAAEQPFIPEKGARLRLLRWHSFVKAENDTFMRLVAAFTEATGVSIEVSSASNLEVALKCAWASQMGSGPDLIWTTYADAHLYPEKLTDLGDVAEYLGGKLGGWYPIAQEYGVHNGSWVCLPVAVSGNYMTYRSSWLKEAGFDAFPTDLDGFLRMAKRLKANGRPMGLSLGPSMVDGNCWAHWLLWTFGGAAFDEADRATINSPETLQALEYLRELYPHFIDGTLGWTDNSNNQAFAAGEISCTNNNAAIYAELVAARDPIAADTDHALYPVGPLGHPAELHMMRPMLLFKYSKFPNAAKVFMSFLMDHPNYDGLLEGATASLTQTLKAYETHRIWAEDPKCAVFREAAARCKSIAYKGKLGYAAAAILSDGIVLTMFADVAAGRRTPKEAANHAEQQVARYLVT
jgi:multiple sugar transport system substrate-binding protein